VSSKDLFPGVFSRHALAYQRRLEDVMERGEARGRTRVMELVRPTPGMRILDLACGPGTLTGRLARMVQPGGEVIGVDLAPGMIELARGGAPPGTRFEVMDIEALEFEAAVFDAATCGHGLQFVPDLDRALREARRVLRPRSRLAASVPVEGIDESVWALLREAFDRWLPAAPQAADRAGTQAAVADAEQLASAARAAGFTSA
jgi:ubiquinone/menaquinone biosynthesis C-methylase UbiE